MYYYMPLHRIRRHWVTVTGSAFSRSQHHFGEHQRHQPANYASHHIFRERTDRRVVYNFLLVPYTWDGTNNATYNYLTSGAPTANATAVTTPSVTTVTASSISTSGASSGGNAVSDGGGTISAKGVVWDVTANPTIGSNLGSTNDGTGTTSTAAASAASALKHNTTTVLM